MSKTIEKPSIERRKYQQFFADFHAGRFGRQRLGQAFYNEFNLHRINDQASLFNLHAKDGDHAVKLIVQIFDIH